MASLDLFCGSFALVALQSKYHRELSVTPLLQNKSPLLLHQSIMFALSRQTAARMRHPSAHRTFAASLENLTKTELFDWHQERGGDMVPFAGYALPVLYKYEEGGVMKEHLWCREQASLFDVSHMGQVRLVCVDNYTRVVTI